MLQDDIGRREMKEPLPEQSDRNGSEPTTLQRLLSTLRSLCSPSGACQKRRIVITVNHDNMNPSLHFNCTFETLLLALLLLGHMTEDVRCVGSDSWLISKRHVTSGQTGATVVGSQSPGERRINTAARRTSAHPDADASCCNGRWDAGVHHASASSANSTASSSSSSDASSAATVRISGDQWTDADGTHVARRHQRTGMHC